MTTRTVALSILVSIATSTSSFALEIQPGNCARAAAYSEKNRGFSMLVMQNGKTVFEHYANGGGPEMRCKIFRVSRSEEHTSELQSQSNLVCRLLLEKKKNKIYTK